MSAIAHEITGISTVCSKVWPGAPKKTSKLRVTGLCEGNPPVTGGFPSQRASKSEIVSIRLHHHAVSFHVFGVKPFYSLGHWICGSNFNFTRMTLKFITKNNNSSTLSGNGLVLQGNKPLPDPMLFQIYVTNELIISLVDYHDEGHRAICGRNSLTYLILFICAINLVCYMIYISHMTETFR